MVVLGTQRISVYRAKGRKPSVDVEKVKELRDSGMGASAIAKELVAKHHAAVECRV